MRKEYNFYKLIIHIVLIIFAFCTLYPFYNVVLLSFATSKSISEQIMYLLPKTFDFNAYLSIFNNQMFFNSLFITFFITIIGTTINLIVTFCGAYALSKKTLPGRKIIINAIIFTMLFSGGLIPYYLNIKTIGLVDSVWVMIFPVAISTAYLFIIMNYLKNIPSSIEESAKIDGANEIVILFKIILPTSLPTVAVMSLFYAVDRWNEWWYALLFISDIDKYPMQMLLKDVLFNTTDAHTASYVKNYANQSSSAFPEAVKMAAIVVSTIPVIVIYPFLQKHFTEGIIIGAVKS